MGVKCIAIGNRIMGDDGIGIKVAEAIMPLLQKESIEVIFGETDAYYALDKIDNGDFVFIIDATCFGGMPGSISFMSLDRNFGKRKLYSQHQSSLIDLLNTYRKPLEGYIIGIEVITVEFSMDLSNALMAEFPHICEEVYEFICNTIRRDQRA